MPEPLSAHLAVAAVAEQLGKAAVNSLGRRLATSVATTTQKGIDQLAASFRVGLDAYLQTSVQKCRFFKTIINPNEPLDLTTYYVHVTLTCNHKTLSDDQLIANIPDLRCVVITGSAGSGKSMFMRFLTISAMQYMAEPRTGRLPGAIPLFIELRYLNSLSNRSLLTYIRNACTSRLSIVNERQFELSLSAGAFLLILDGFDELNHDIRDEIQRQILEIRKDFPETVVVVSSRPDDRYKSWTEFHIYKVDDLTKEQTLKLVESLPYDGGVKRRFLREVNEKLFETHRSFLSSPLLATIMLLTYEGFAEIPNRMHAFYSRAFDTLFQKHDAQKEQFQRQSYSGLSLDEFKDHFSVFCAMSYLQEQYSFSSDKLIETAKSSIEYVNKNRIGEKSAGNSTRRPKKVQSLSALTPESFIADLHESVCMLQRDGLEVSFIHRSFQEYFASRFATTLGGNKIAKLLDKYSQRLGDSVMFMLFDMYQDPVEQQWVLPWIDRFDKIFAAADGKEKISKALEPFLARVAFHIEEQAVIPFFADFEINMLGPLETISRIYFPPAGGFLLLRHMRGLSANEFSNKVLIHEYSSYAKLQAIPANVFGGRKARFGKTCKQVPSSRRHFDD